MRGPARYCFGQVMRVRVINILFFCLALLLAGAPVCAQAPQPSEYQLKAAFLFNFAKYIDWPAESFTNDKAPFLIGILGDNPFGSALEQIVAGKKINEHPITIQPLRAGTEGTNCHIIFVSSSEKKRLPEIMQSLHGAAVLTVGETEKFIETGGIINFVPEANKIRFQINDDAAKAAKLKISSKLLSLAVKS